MRDPSIAQVSDVRVNFEWGSGIGIGSAEQSSRARQSGAADADTSRPHQKVKSRELRVSRSA